MKTGTGKVDILVVSVLVFALAGSLEQGVSAQPSSQRSDVAADILAAASRDALHGVMDPLVRQSVDERVRIARELVRGMSNRASVVSVPNLGLGKERHDLGSAGGRLAWAAEQLVGEIAQVAVTRPANEENIKRVQRMLELGVDAFARGSNEIVRDYSAAGSQPDAGRRRAVSATRGASSVERDTYQDRVTDTVAAWRDIPAYERDGLVSQLLPLVLSGEESPTPDAGGRVRHNRSYIAGRAAWAIEELLGAELRPVLETRRQLLQEVHQEAASAVTGYRRGILARARERKLGVDTDVAGRMFAGKIKPGMLDERGLEDQAGLMDVVLRTWCPYNKKLSELEHVTGVKSRKEDRTVRLSFYRGFGGGICWEFGIDDDDRIVYALVR